MHSASLRTVFCLGLVCCGSAQAQLTWQLGSGSGSWPADKRNAIIAAMNEAVEIYNSYGYFSKNVTASYNAGVPTAQANYDGLITFGGSIGARVAMHEISHTLGVGTYSEWDPRVVNGLWTGTFANNRIKLFQGPSAVIGCDGNHFWDYGLNYDTEDSALARERHVKMVSAFRRDMGIVTDSDGDGIPNDWEMFYFGDLSKSGSGDADGDGITNLAEYQADTNPGLFIFQWTGASSTNWTTAANWSTIRAPSGSTYYSRLNVNNHTGNALYYTGSQGSTTYRPLQPGRGVVIGSGGTNASGSMFITGGVFSTLGSVLPDVLGNGSGNTGSLVVDGGTFSSSELHFGVLGMGSGVFTVQSGTANVEKLVYRFASGGTGTLHLNGGTLNTGSLARAEDAPSGTANIRFHGGTLRPTASTETFLQGLSSALVRSGGAIFDTNGFSISVAQPLLNDASSPGGGLTKLGSGTLTLPSANTFTGPVQVDDGILRITASSALGTTANGVAVASGATLALAGGISTAIAESVSLAGAGSGSRGALQSDSGANVWSGPITINATDTRIGVQDGASLVLAGSITEATPGLRVVFRAGLTNGNDITVSGPSNAWTGPTSLFSGSGTGGRIKLGRSDALPITSLLQVAGSGVSGVLDLNGFHQSCAGLAHWTSGSSALGDGVVTNSAGTESILTLNVPTSVTREFSGTIQNGGGIRLVKSGGGTQILSSANSYAGGTLVEAGTLRQGVTAALGPNTAALSLTGGSLNVNGLALGVGRLDGTGGVIQNNLSGTQPVFTFGHGNANGGDYTGSIADRNTGTGTLAVSKTGSGIQSLGGNNSFSGPLTVDAGVLLVASNSALGSATGTTTVANNATLRLADGVTINNESVTLLGTGSAFNGALQAAPAARAQWGGPIVLGDAAARVGAGVDGTLVIAGPIMGSGAFQNLNIGAGTTGAGSVELATPAGQNSYTGSTAIIRGTLKLASQNALPVGTSLDIDSANASEAAVFDLNGYNQTIARLQRSNSGGGTGTATLTNTSNTPATLTIAQADVSSYNGRVEGNLSLTKSGLGSLTLSGINNYSGNTTVTGGTLVLTNPTLSTSSTVTVNAGVLQISGNHRVATLIIDGVSKAPGIYQSANTGGRLAGTGSIEIAAPPTSYSTWINAFSDLDPAERDMLADPDGDGSNNLQEFAFGSNPTLRQVPENGRTALIDTDADPSGLAELTLTIPVRANAQFTPAASNAGMEAVVDGIRYLVSGSHNLIHYTAPVAEVTPHRGIGQPSLGYTWKTFRLVDSNGLPNQGFLKTTIQVP